MRRERNQETCSGKIYSISNIGLLTIRYETAMFTDFEFKDLNSTLIDIYVVQLEASLGNINFTWEFQGFSDNKLNMFFKLTFADPL